MLAGRVALVTNALHFLGPAVAAEMAAQGALVACHDRSFAEPAGREGFLATRPGIEALAEQDPRAAVAAVEARHGRLDVLVSNQAFPAIRAPVEAASLNDLRAGLEALLVEPFAFAAAAAPGMKARRAGKILLVTSAAPLRGLPNYAMYAAARGGANALAVSLAKELAPHNVQVNAVAPNFVESPSYFPPELLADPAARARIVRNIPLGRLARPEEAAALVAFLASDRADFITGQVVPFAGGWA